MMCDLAGLVFITRDGIVGRGERMSTRILQLDPDEEICVKDNIDFEYNRRKILDLNAADAQSIPSYFNRYILAKNEEKYKHRIMDHAVGRDGAAPFMGGRCP